jgi:hypothetical protein
MAGWRVEYEKSDSREVKTVHITLPDDDYKTAGAVQAAIQQGKIAEVKVKAGGMVLVQQHNSNTMGE